MSFKIRLIHCTAGCAIVAAMLTSCALANPGGMAAGHDKNQAMSDRFARMDKNGDGKVVLEEFRTEFPNMNEKAFTVIDANGDNGIERAEWFEFTANHAKGAIPGMSTAPRLNNTPGDPLIPSPDNTDLPLMRPPN